MITVGHIPMTYVVGRYIEGILKRYIVSTALLAACPIVLSFCSVVPPAVVVDSTTGFGVATQESPLLLFQIILSHS